MEILQRAIMTLSDESYLTKETKSHLSLAKEALETGRFYNVMRELGAVMRAADSAF